MTSHHPPLRWIIDPASGPSSLLFLLLLLTTPPTHHMMAQAQAACGVNDVLSDFCASRLDGSCDNDGVVCAANQDCFDCDPCRPFDATSCDACTANTAGASCAWCISGITGLGVCSSTNFATAVENFCANDGGTVWQTTCNDFVVDCDPNNDSCHTVFDGVCDADGSRCATGSDCFDCDPCQQYDNCDDCTAGQGSAGDACQWCPDRLDCSSLNLLQLLPASANYECDYTNVCEAPSDVCSNTDTSVDPCPLALNGRCEADGNSCLRNTDCFDCDPCMEFRYEGCAACTAAGCLWCGADALCVSAGAPLPNNDAALLQCTEADLLATCPGTNDNPFPDPLFNAMDWVYEMINVKPVWASGVTGAGVGIRINDEGVDADHPDFFGRFDVASSCANYLPYNLIVAEDDDNSHGTTCAALAAAGGNGACSVGIAPNATVSSCRIFNSAGGFDEEIAVDYLYLYENMDNMDISSNSYAQRGCSPIDSEEWWLQNRRLQSTTCPFSSTAEGSPCLFTSVCTEAADWSDPSTLSPACEREIVAYCEASYETDVQGCISFLDLFVSCVYNGESPEGFNATTRGVTEGRDGKGIIYLFASGNDFMYGDDLAFQVTLNSRFSINVASVGKDGMHARYSTPGAALFVSGPGGDIESYTNIVVAKAGGGCQDAGVGTSYATPIVAGVIALCLEVNPSLTWRDVQGIIATTSQKVDEDNPSWTTNGAGLHHSYLYGFGVVDANAAVNAAMTWTNFSPEGQRIGESSQINLSIPDFPGGPVESVITIAADATFVTESVVVYLDLQHSTRGDLDLILVSPNGTESLLAPGQRPENTQTSERWKLMTVRNWGEAAGGDWTLRIVDLSAGDLLECENFDGWSAVIDGAAYQCNFFENSESCLNGGQGPGFNGTFAGYSGLSDPLLADMSGLTPDQACCECGGGEEVPNVDAILFSWRLAVYGHTVVAPDTVPTPPSPAPQPAPSAPTPVATPALTPQPVAPSAPTPATTPTTTSAPQATDPPAPTPGSPPFVPLSPIPPSFSPSMRTDSQTVGDSGASNNSATFVASFVVLLMLLQL